MSAPVPTSPASGGAASAVGSSLSRASDGRSAGSGLRELLEGLELEAADGGWGMGDGDLVADGVSIVEDGMMPGGTRVHAHAHGQIAGTACPDVLRGSLLADSVAYVDVDRAAALRAQPALDSTEGVCFIDVRPAAAARAGAIPGALNCYAEVMDWCLDLASPVYTPALLAGGGLVLYGAGEDNEDRPHNGDAEGVLSGDDAAAHTHERAGGCGIDSSSSNRGNDGRSSPMDKSVLAAVDSAALEKQAALSLIAAGIPNVMILRGGFAGWARSGHPIAETPAPRWRVHADVRTIAPRRTAREAILEELRDMRVLSVAAAAELWAPTVGARASPDGTARGEERSAAVHPHPEGRVLFVDVRRVHTIDGGVPPTAGSIPGAVAATAALREWYHGNGSGAAEKQTMQSLFGDLASTRTKAVLVDDGADAHASVVGDGDRATAGPSGGNNVGCATRLTAAALRCVLPYHPQVAVLAGGLAAWRRAGLPLQPLALEVAGNPASVENVLDTAQRVWGAVC